MQITPFNAEGGCRSWTDRSQKMKIKKDISIEGGDLQQLPRLFRSLFGKDLVTSDRLILTRSVRVVRGICLHPCPSKLSWQPLTRRGCERERLYTGTSTLPTCNWHPLRERALGQDLPGAGICLGICANAQQMPWFLKDLLTGIWAFAAILSKRIINILFSQDVCGHLCCAQW